MFCASLACFFVHLFRCLDEEVFRFNNRAYADSDRFNMIAKSVSGEHLTYAELTTSCGAYYDEVMLRV